MIRPVRVATVILLGSALGCGSDSKTITTPPPPPPSPKSAVVVLSSGDAQKGPFNVALPSPLVVSVSTPTGDPLANLKVNWGIVAGGGSLSSASSMTDQNGKASVTWTLGPNVNQSVKAWTDVEGSQSVTFTATGESPPTPPPALTAISAWPDTNVIFTGMTRTLGLNIVRGSTSSWGPADSWSSSDPAVATVDKNGVVTAVGVGQVAITGHLDNFDSPPVQVFVKAAPTPALRFMTGAGTCGLTTDGLLYCWDKPFFGMTGPFDRCETYSRITGMQQYECSEIPRLVSSDLRFKALTGGVDAGCAVTIDGAIYCWGSNQYGGIGLGFKDDVPRGLTRVPIDGEFVEVSGGYFTHCALRNDGVILCWGSNNRGDTGTGSPDVNYSSAVVTPTPVNTSVRFSKLGRGGNCGLAVDSTAYCWGSFVGDVALPGCNTACTLSPVQVNIEKLVDLETGGTYCGIGVSGRAYCWGFHGANDPYRYAKPQEIPNPDFRSFELGLHALDGSGNAFDVSEYAALWRFSPVGGTLRYKRYWGTGGVTLDDKLYSTYPTVVPVSYQQRLIPGQ